MNRKMITLDKGLSVKSAIKLMVKKNIGSVVITADSSSKLALQQAVAQIHQQDSSNALRIVNANGV
jgi:predicted transcriptional regulator